MASISVDRHTIVAAGGRSSGVDVRPGNGFVELEILHEGVRVIVRMSPQEAAETASGVAVCAGVVLERSTDRRIA